MKDISLEEKIMNPCFREIHDYVKKNRSTTRDEFRRLGKFLSNQFKTGAHPTQIILTLACYATVIYGGAIGFDFLNDTRKKFSQAQIGEKQTKIREHQQIQRDINSMESNHTLSEAELHYIIGNAYMEKKDFNSAIENFYQALEIDPNFSDAYYMLWNLNKKIGQDDEAIRHYIRFLQNAPTDPHSNYVPLSNHIFNNENRQVSYNKIDANWQKHDDPSEYFLGFGLLLFLKGSDQASEYLKKSIEHDYHNIYARYTLAKFYNVQGNKLAISEYIKVINLKPDISLLRLEFADYLHDVGDHSNARKQYEVVLRIDPTNIHAKHMLRVTE